MKLSKEQLKQIIKEEFEQTLNECGEMPMEAPEIAIAHDDQPCGCPDMAHYHNNDEGSMSRSQLMHMRGYVDQLMQMIEDHDNLPEWVESKITLANDYISKVKHYLEGEMARDQGMLENKRNKK
jgi:hypothetical protein